jgi:Lrp/AsnC family transcriptional regulator, regulator for asnA, asnC and gidA
MIDNLSYQLLKALSKDGRYSFTKLAKELKIKVSTVSNKVNKMLEDDLISIQAVPNTYRIGYKFQAVIALNVDLNQIYVVCDTMMDNPHISSIAVMYGRFNLLVFAEFPDIDMLIKLVREELPDIKGVTRIETFLVSERKKSYEKFFAQDSLVYVPAHLDDIDKQLIAELRLNGRANLAHLASKYNISTASVTRRVASLIKRDIIKITVVPNHTKLLGFTAVAYLAIETELSKVNEVCEQLSNFPEIHTVMTLISGFNILAILVMQNHDVLYQFVTNKVLSIDGVIDVETLIRAELKKRTYVYINDTQIQNALGIDVSPPG